MRFSGLYVNLIRSLEELDKVTFGRDQISACQGHLRFPGLYVNLIRSLEELDKVYGGAVEPRLRQGYKIGPPLHVHLVGPGHKRRQVGPRRTQIGRCKRQPGPQSGHVDGVRILTQQCSVLFRGLQNQPRKQYIPFCGCNVQCVGHRQQVGQPVLGGGHRLLCIGHDGHGPSNGLVRLQLSRLQRVTGHDQCVPRDVNLAPHANLLVWERLILAASPYRSGEEVGPCDDGRLVPSREGVVHRRTRGKQLCKLHEPRARVE